MIINVSDIDNKGITMINDKCEKFLTYKMLYREAVYTLCMMRDKGIKKGDEVVIYTDSTDEFIILFWASILGGFIAIPISCSYSAESFNRLSNILDKLKSPYVFSNEKNLNAYKSFCEKNRIEENKFEKYFSINKFLDFDNYLNCFDLDCKFDRISEDDVAFIQFSSGSTDVPKGVILTHGNIISNVKAIIKGLNGIYDYDSSFSWLPLTHDMGLIGFHLSPMYCQANQYIMLPMYFMKKPLKWLEKVSEYKCTIINSPNFGYEYIFRALQKNVDLDFDLSHVRVIFNGAEPVIASTCNKFLNIFEKNNLRKNSFFPVYGLAEASLAVTFPDVESNLETVFLSRESLNIGSFIERVNEKDSNSVCFVKLGQAIEECDYRLTDDEGNICNHEVVGNIEINGKNIAKGYYLDSLQTELLYTDDGWLKTGDIGVTVDDQLIVVGRKKEMMIINGKNFFPSDIEKIVAASLKKESFEFAATSIYDANANKDILLLFVIFKSRLSDFCETNKIIQRIINLRLGVEVITIPVISFPKTTSGKIQRNLLKYNYESGIYDNIIEELNAIYSNYLEEEKKKYSLTETEKKLSEIFSNEFNRIYISVYEEYSSYGINSLKLVKIVNEIRNEFPSCDIDISIMYTFKTIKQLGEYIDKQNKKDDNDSIIDLDVFIDKL